MNQYDAIYNRKAVKSFKTESVSEQLLSQILTFSNYITDISGNHSVNFEIWSSTQKEKMLEHHFALKAPYYFVLYADADENQFLNLGYVAEQVALYLYTKGLGSCFAGLKKEKKNSQDQISEARLLVVLAFGIPKEETISNKPRFRKSLDGYCVFKDNADPSIKDMIKTAVYSPSRLNYQPPWRLVVMKNRIHVFSKRDRSVLKTGVLDKHHELDIGILLAHLCIAGEEFWYNTKIVKNGNLAEKNYKNNIYICTVICTEQQSELEQQCFEESQI